MPNAPEALQPYIFHGIDLDWQEGDKEAKGDCPFCGRENKFSVDIRTGKYRCFICGDDGTTGNAYSFLRKFWTLCDKQTTDYESLRIDRKLQYAETFMQWGVVRSITTGNWLIPGYGLKTVGFTPYKRTSSNSIGYLREYPGDDRLQQLYQRKQIKSKGKWRWQLLPTPKVAQSKANKGGHRLHGLDLYDKDKSTVYLCEGPWDGMALWEMLRQAKQTDNGLASTANPEASLLADANVLAVPGCNVFFASWLPLFTGKVVNLMFDNDHPRTHPKTKQKIAPAGLRAMERVGKFLMQAKPEKLRPAEVNYLRWSGDEQGYNLDLPSGHDVRDALNETH